MIFGDGEDGEEQEVRISATEEDKESSEDTSRLEKEAASELTDAESDSVTLEDIHRQNERIIELLEDISGEDEEDQRGGAATDQLL